MKIRNGFVSNSSSSSFVVMFPFKPKNEKQVKDLLFPNKDLSDRIHEDTYMTVQSVVTRVFQDIKKQNRSASIKKIKDEIKCSWGRQVGYSLGSNDKLYLELCKLEDWNNESRMLYRAESQKLNYYIGPDILNFVHNIFQRDDIEILNSVKIVKDILSNKKYALLHATNSNQSIQQLSNFVLRNNFMIKQKAINEIEKFAKWRLAQIKMGKTIDKQRNTIENKIHEKVYEKFMKNATEKSWIGIFSYSDNTDEGTALEHGDIFNKLKRVTISHH